MSDFSSEGSRLHWRVLHHGAGVCEIDAALRLAVQRERERCADLCDGMATYFDAAPPGAEQATDLAASTCRALAESIRRECTPPPEPPEPRGGKEGT